MSDRQRTAALKAAHDELEQRVRDRTAELARANDALIGEITERARVENELRRRTMELQAIFLAFPDLHFRLDPSGAILEYHAGREADLYLPPEDFLGRRMQDVLPPDVGRQFEEAVTQLVSTQRPVAFEYVLPLANGERSFEARVLPLPDEQIITIVRDITQQKEAERQLRQREEYFRSLIENGGDIIGIIDSAGVIRYDSPSVERVLGYQPRELAGRSVFKYLHPDDVPRTRTMLEDVLESPGEGVHVDFQFRHADGSYRLLEAVGKPLLIDGQLEGVVINARDVTQRKLQEQALQRAMREAEDARQAADRANQAKSDFLSRMSHELRTPMNSILGFAQLMARKELAPDQRRAVDHILKAGRHLLNLINEVLDITRIESNREQFSIEPVQVRPLLQETINLIRPLGAQYGVRVESSLVLGKDFHVNVDRQRLMQVLLNLLSNAVKYNRPGGLVGVSCIEPEGRPGRLSIRVHDTGYGIAPEKQARLFTPFDRLGAEHSEVEGTGLGLALSKRLVDAMGGTLHVESTANTGSTFSVELPMVDSPMESLMEAPGISERAAGDGPGRTATVLYIEDNLANLSLIETILAGRPEITLMSALQGQLGLELAWQHTPDLILLDLHLPDVSGDDVLRKLRGDARTSSTPVVVISADATTVRAQRLMEAGADAYVTKPLDIDDFMETVDRLLGGRASE